MAWFGLKRSFGIDDGELDGIPARDCFVLGYELALWDERLAKQLPFSMLAHAENLDRMKAALPIGVQCKLIWHEGDESETWVTVVVSGFANNQNEG